MPDIVLGAIKIKKKSKIWYVNTFSNFTFEIECRWDKMGMYLFCQLWKIFAILNNTIKYLSLTFQTMMITKNLKIWTTFEKYTIHYDYKNWNRNPSWRSDGLISL